MEMMLKLKFETLYFEKMSEVRSSKAFQIRDEIKKISLKD